MVPTSPFLSRLAGLPWKKILFAGFAILVLCFGALALYAHSLMQKEALGVPVLNYHQINDRDKNALTVTTKEFDAQMKLLSQEGYTTITPEEMIAAWNGEGKLPDKPVIITLDDGYADNYENAYPILKKYHLRATIFLISDFMDRFPNYLTWSEVAEMQESGLIDFESHTLSHEELSKVSDENEIWTQLDDSRKALEWNIGGGKRIRFIAYPCGEYDQRVEELTKEAGYDAAFTVNYGWSLPTENRYYLSRVPIFGGVNHSLLRFKLRLAYGPVVKPLLALKKDLDDRGWHFLARHIQTP